MFASPVIGPDGTIYIGSLDGSFSALAADGSLRFRYAASDKIYASAAIGPDGKIFVGSMDRTLTALNAQGAVEWRQELAGGIDASPLVSADSVYVVADGLRAYDFDGQLRFHVPVSGHVRSTPALHPTGLVVFGTPEGEVWAVHTSGDNAGTIAWRSSVGSSVDGGLSIADDGTIYVGTDAGLLLALDAAGQERWRAQLGTEGQPRSIRATPAIAPDGTIIVGCYDHHLYAFSPSGEQRWRVETAGRIRGSARIDSEGRIYVGSQDDSLYAFSLTGERIFSVNLGQDIDSTAAIGPDGTLYIGSDDGGLHALR